MEAILKLLHHQRLNPSTLATSCTLKLKNSAWTRLTSLPPANVTLGVQQPTVSGRKESVTLGTQNPCIKSPPSQQRTETPASSHKWLPTKQLQPHVAVWMEGKCGCAVSGVTKEGYPLCSQICHQAWAFPRTWRQCAAPSWRASMMMINLWKMWVNNVGERNKTLVRALDLHANSAWLSKLVQWNMKCLF